MQTNSNSAESIPLKIDRRRYQRTTRFFAMMILNIIVWDVVLGKFFFLRGRIAKNRPNRYRQFARQFSQLATEMGGVMIKLGQFLSSRIDVLPPEIVEELRILQDAVPPIDSELIFGVVSAELGEYQTCFFDVEKTALAAASLGQTHRAWLKNEDGTRGKSIVIKVQRPDIERLVYTDLAALRVVAQWMMKYRPIRERANAPALMEEFSEVLWEELDYRAELKNAERFRTIFHDYQGVYVPQFYEQYCTARILAIENVGGLKINDLEKLREAGIDAKQLADRLLEVYYIQVFEHSFFHADPHPGNLFIRAYPEREHKPEEGVPFDIVFIDFGMMGRISADIIDALQKALISITTRDGQGFVSTLDELGFFLPSVDLERLAEAQEEILNQIWGRDLTQLAQPDPAEVRDLSRRFKDILFEFPFQVPQNFIYLGRTLGILSGLSAMLNPDINPWHYIEKYGQRLIRRRQSKLFQWSNVMAFGQDLLAVPIQLRRIVADLERGRVRVVARPNQRTEKQLDRIERQNSQLNSTLLAVGGLICGTLLYLHGDIYLGVGFWTVATLIGVGSLFRF